MVERLAGDQHPVLGGQAMSDGDLVGGQRTGPDAGRQLHRGRRAPVDAALAAPGMEGVEKVLEQRRRRRFGAQPEAAQLDRLQLLEQAPDERLERTRRARRPGTEIVGPGRQPGEADADATVGMAQEPGVEFGLHGRQRTRRCRRVGGDDEELAGGIDHLAGGRQIQRFQHPQRGQFRQQRDLEGTPAQQLGGAFLGLAAGGEDEVLDAVEIALDQQEFLALPGVVGQFAGGALVIPLGAQRFPGRGRIVVAVGVIAPQRDGQGGGGARMIVQRHLRPDAAGGGRGNGVGIGLPEAVEMVQPQGQVAPMAGGDLRDGGGEALPKRAVLGLRPGVAGGFAVGRRHREQGAGRERRERVAVVRHGGFRPAVQADLLQQGPLPLGVMVEFPAIVVGRRVVAGERLALETGGQPVGAGDDPLQEGIRPVMSGGGVDDGIVGVALAPGREGGHDIAHQLGQVGLQQVEADGGIGGVDMGGPALETGAVELFFPLGPAHAGRVLFLGLGDPRPFGELAQVVQVGRQGHAGSGIQSFRIHPKVLRCS